MIGISHKPNSFRQRLVTLINLNKVTTCPPYRWIFLLLLALFSFSCATGVLIEAPAISLQRVENIVVQNLPGGARSRSVNGREFKSYYFSPNGDIPRPEAQSVRNTAHVIILGSRRPYSVNLRVIREQRLSDGTYMEVGEDRGAAERMAKTLKQELDKGRRERNLVDDFRVF